MELAPLRPLAAYCHVPSDASLANRRAHVSIRRNADCIRSGDLDFLCMVSACAGRNSHGNHRPGRNKRHARPLSGLASAVPRLAAARRHIPEPVCASSLAPRCTRPQPLPRPAWASAGCSTWPSAFFPWPSLCSEWVAFSLAAVGEHVRWSVAACSRRGGESMPPGQSLPPV